MSKSQRDFIVQLILAKEVKLNLHGHHHTRYSRRLRECLVTGLAEDGKSFEDNRLVLPLETLKQA